MKLNRKNVFPCDEKYLRIYSLSFLFLFFCNMLYCFHLVQGLGEGSRVVKKLPRGCREGLQVEALTPEGLLKCFWASEAPSHACS